MRQTLKTILALASAVALGSCAAEPPEPPPGATGSAALALAQVPLGVACLRLQVTAARSVVRLFPLVPGEAAEFLVAGLPVGPAVFTADAFAEACDSVASVTVPGWISAPVSAVVVANALTDVALVLRRNGRARVGITFDDDEAAGLPDGGADASADAGGAHDAGAGDAEASCRPVINEVQVGGPGGAADEFVELYNGCSTAYALSGVRLVYRSAAGTSDVVLGDLSAFELAPGQHFLIVGSGYTGAAPGDAMFSQGLAAAGGGLALRRGDELLDSVGYGTANNAFVEGSPAAAPPSGSSLARLPNGRDTNDNAADFRVGTPTPRAANL